MPTTYDSAPDDVLDVLKSMLTQHHPDLIECGAEIGVLFATNLDGPAVKTNGYPRAARVKVVPQKDRVRKQIDAEIIIDATVWQELHPDQQAALIDHECEHLKRVEYTEKQLAKLRKDDPDAVAWKVDSLNRPKLKTVPADIDVGDAFSSIIERHGKAACEFRNAEQFRKFAEQAMAGRASA